MNLPAFFCGDDRGVRVAGTNRRTGSLCSRLDGDGNVLAEPGNWESTAQVQDRDEPSTGTYIFWFTTRLSMDGELSFCLGGEDDGKVISGQLTENLASVGLDKP